MIADFFRWIAQGYLAPRASVRRLLDGGYGIETIIGLLLLGYLISSILMLLVPADIPQTGNVIARHTAGLFSMAVQFSLFGALIYWVGRMFGGVGTLPETYLVLAWYVLVTSFLVPLPMSLLAMVQPIEGPDGTLVAPTEPVVGNIVILAMVAIALCFWLLVRYVAELHGFKNTWGVLGVFFGASFVFGILMSSILSALAGYQ